MKQQSISTEYVNKKSRFSLILTVLFVVGYPLSISAEPQQAHDHVTTQVEQDHEQHDEHEEPELRFSVAQLQEFSIKLAQTKPGVISKTSELAGEVIVAPERLYHVVPRVSGVVR